MLYVMGLPTLHYSFCENVLLYTVFIIYTRNHHGLIYLIQFYVLYSFMYYINWCNTEKYTAWKTLRCIIKVWKLFIEGAENNEEYKKKNELWIKHIFLWN